MLRRSPRVNGYFVPDELVEIGLMLCAFAQETPEAASAQWRTVADQIRPTVPKLAAIMDDAEPVVLAYMTFPKEHRAKLHSTDEIDKRSLSAVVL